MKTMTFKNKLNGEQFLCDDAKAVEVIDGVEYLVVRRFNQDRRFLMRKESLEKVKPNTSNRKPISK